MHNGLRMRQTKIKFYTFLSPRGGVEGERHWGWTWPEGWRIPKMLFFFDVFFRCVFRSLFEEKWSPKGIPFGSKIDKNGVQKHTFSGYLKK